MQTLTVHGVVTDKGTLRIEKIETPVDLPPGPVEVEVTIRPAPSAETPAWDWTKIRGLGAEIWQGVDVLEYIRELREDRELPS
jgi:hypothetical protein